MISRKKKEGLFMCFIWNEQVFIRFLFFLTQEGLHITGTKRLAFFGTGDCTC